MTDLSTSSTREHGRTASALTDPAPMSLETVLEADWLSSALSIAFPGTRVTAVHPGPVISRVATNARFTIEGELPEGLPRSLCVKGYFPTEEGQPLGAGRIEGAFYGELAASSGISTLNAVYAGVDSETRHGIFITEDVVANGATFLDALSHYTPEQAARSLGELARLHAATWQRSSLANLEWLDSRTSTFGRGVPEINQNFETEIGAGVPESVRDAAWLVDAYVRVIDDAQGDDEWCVTHGDAHLGNFFLDAEGHPCLLDWQLVSRSHWYIDVGYHLGSALPVDVRRAHERALVAHYLRELAAHGGPVIDEEAAWEGVRRGYVYGFFMWAITLQVAPEITTELNTRLGTACADHDLKSRL